MSLDQHISVTLLVNNSGITQQSFGTIAHLSYNATWTDPSRSYSKKSEAVADGFASDGPEVTFLNSVFSQSPRPPTAKIIRGTRPPTQHYTLVATPLNLHTYEVDASGQGVTPTQAIYTSDSTATAAKIHNGLVTQLQAVVGRNYTATFPTVAFGDFTYTVPVFANGQLHAVAHGRQTGDGPIQLTNVGGAVPGGTALITNYWLIRVGPDDLQLADSLAHALAGVSITLTNAGTGTQTIQHQAGTLSPNNGVSVTATSAGAWFNLAVVDTTTLSIAQDHTDPGISADLDAAQAADKDWYWLHTAYNSKAMMLPAFAWVEGTPFKMYFADTCDSAVENNAVTTGDVIDTWATLGYRRSMPMYRRKLVEMTSAGLMGQLSPLAVGTWTVAYKNVIGSSADSFTTQQITNMTAKRATYYKSEAGRSVAWEGQVANLSYGFADVTISLDFVLNLIQTRGFSLLSSLPKLPYTDEGITSMKGAITGAIDVCSSDAHQIVALGTPGDPNDPEPTVVFPRVADIDPSVRATRRLPPGDVNFRLQAAIHAVDIDLTVIF